MHYNCFNIPTGSLSSCFMNYVEMLLVSPNIIEELAILLFIQAIFVFGWSLTVTSSLFKLMMVNKLNNSKRSNNLVLCKTFLWLHLNKGVPYLWNSASIYTMPRSELYITISSSISSVGWPYCFTSIHKDPLNRQNF